jgi:leader peptidase (prepilin peptidase)/N-methyltransferase
MDVPLWMMELTAKVLLQLWLFAMGATIGSFLNVVVYRLPRGMNLAYPGSFCPRCHHAIRLNDNVPLLSWLVLGGRCRDCKTPIPIRYFLVELTVATMFLVVLACEKLPAISLFGLTLRRPLVPYDGAPYWTMYGLHLLLPTTLLAAALIAADGFRVPRRLYLPVIVCGLALPLVWPEIHIVPAAPQTALSGWRAGLIDGLAGLAAGGAVGFVIAFSIERLSGRWLALAPGMLCASIGVVFGWQRAVLWSPIVLPICVLAARALRPLRAPGSDLPLEHSITDDITMEPEAADHATASQPPTSQP